jgi:hypothetical protein
MDCEALEIYENSKKEKALSAVTNDNYLLLNPINVLSSQNKSHWLKAIKEKL